MPPSTANSNDQLTRPTISPVPRGVSSGKALRSGRSTRRRSPSKSSPAPPAIPSLPVSGELMQAIAARAAELVLDSLGGRSSPWLTRGEAAEYLGLPLSRLEKDRRIPCHRDGGRVLYHRDELDAHFLAHGR